MQNYINKIAGKIGAYHLFLVLIVYLSCAIYLFEYTRYLLNPDGPSYITIAEKYAAGNYSEAVNGYWGPMLSWLSVPLILLGYESLFSIRLIILIIGIPTIIAMWQLSGVLKLSPSVRRTILVPTVAWVLYFVNNDVTSDLLLSCVFLLYFTFIFSEKYANSSKQGVICGFLGGIGYLTKSFAFPFFIAHFFLVNLLFYFVNKSKAERKKIAVNFIFGMIVFGVISGIWITIISCKYNMLTYSLSKDMNFYEISPSGSAYANRWYNKGLYPPPNETAISVWEDPYFTFERLPRWRPYESLGSFVYYLKVIVRHIYECFKVFNIFSLLSPLILIAYLIIILYKPRKILNQPLILYPFISLLLIVGGYSMIRLIERLIWPTVFLLLLMAGIVIDKLHQRTFFTRLRRTVVYIILIVSFSFHPTHFLLNRASLMHRNLVTISFVTIINTLKKYIQSGDSIASYNDLGKTHRFSYFLRARYYGLTRNAEDLHKYKIKHYLVWVTKQQAKKMSFPGYRKAVYIAGVNLCIFEFAGDEQLLDPVK